MVNKVILLGRLGQDPELRYTQNKTAVCTLNVATSERRKGADGQWSEHTEWHRVVVFGKTAENCGQYLKKGRQVFVDGRIQTRKWQDKDGKDRYSTEVVANSVQFVGGGKADSDIEVQRSSGSNDMSGAPDFDTSSIGQPVSFDDDDIPF